MREHAYRPRTTTSQTDVPMTDKGENPVSAHLSVPTPQAEMSHGYDGQDMTQYTYSATRKCCVSVV